MRQVEEKQDRTAREAEEAAIESLNERVATARRNPAREEVSLSAEWARAGGGVLEILRYLHGLVRIFTDELVVRSLLLWTGLVLVDCISERGE